MIGNIHIDVHNTDGISTVKLVNRLPRLVDCVYLFIVRSYGVLVGRVCCS